MPYKVDDEQYRQRKREAAGEAADRLSREQARLKAQELNYTAQRLVEASMRPEHPTHKHKWATGKEKWEAVQRAGAVAAGVVKSGKRGPKPMTRQQRAGQLMDQVLNYGVLVADGDPTGEYKDMRESLVATLDSMIDQLDVVDVQLMRAALGW